MNKLELNDQQALLLRGTLVGYRAYTDSVMDKTTKIVLTQIINKLTVITNGQTGNNSSGNTQNS